MKPRINSIYVERLHAIRMQDIFWLAGILEGEGTFFRFKMHRNTGSNSWTPRIQVKMTDPDIIARIAALWGSPVQNCSYPPNKKQPWVAVLNGPKAIGWMMTLLPILGRRRSDKVKSIVYDWKIREGLIYA